MKKIYLSILITVQLFGIIVYDTYDQSNPVECPGRFIANRTDANATLSINGKSFILPANIYLDTSKNLMWLSCPIGYTLSPDKKTCSETTTTTFTWADMYAQVQTINDSVSAIDEGGLHYSDWRVPNIKELRSLYRHPACRVAADYYNIYTLPTTTDTTTINYWSSSPVSGKDGFAWSVNLESGNIQQSDMSNNLRVILVRDLILK